VFSHHRLICCVLVFLFWAASAQNSVAQDNVELGDVREQHKMIPMRDGARLSVYLYFPAGDGPWPPVFEQRYAPLTAKSTKLAASRLASAGYVVALVNFRGTHLSEGKWQGYRALQWGDLQDGYDTCEWLATQKWSTGKVGTFGSSQGGYAQNYLAVTQPPHLTCQYMVDTGLSLFQEGYRIGGTARPERFKSMDAICRNPHDNRDLLEEWFRHPHYDEYWQAEDCTLHFDKMNVPCFTIGSWYDFMNQGSIASFQGRQQHGGPNSKGQQQLIIGPWLHGRSNKSNRVGELVYPENASWSDADHMVRWFNHYLKGEDNGIERDPAVRYYVMGATGEEGTPGNEWREADDFPPASKSVPLFLAEGGELTSEHPTADHSSTSYESDPRQPMQIPGRGFPGARDARPFEAQAQVRTFTTPPLDEPVGWVSQIFNAGHRIRVTVASTGAPLYEPNPQTGEPLTIEFPDNAVNAVNTIHHSQQHASRILAPVPR